MVDQAPRVVCNKPGAECKSRLVYIEEYYCGAIPGSPCPTTKAPEQNHNDLQSAVLEAQLRKNSCKILTDGKGNVKSIETKVYTEDGIEAVKTAVKMQIEAEKRLSEVGLDTNK